ncbi:T9SS type A sorting domain-containing protein [Bacteroidota bacterium]
MTAFPNPCNDILNISHIPPGAKIELYNTLGYKVYEANRVTGNALNIDCSNFESGVYFLRITGKENSHFERIVIMK